jgi:hypothetical protein
MSVWSAQDIFSKEIEAFERRIEQPPKDNTQTYVVLQLKTDRATHE